MANLGQLEAAVMDHLWSSKTSLTVRDVLEQLHPDRPLAYTTVLTVLDNLHTKGMVQREKAGRAFVYRASAPRDAYIASLMSDALSTTRDRRSALMRFVEKMSASEIKNLRQALAEIDNEAPRRGPRTKSRDT